MMALETWLVKVKKTISSSFDSVRAAPRAKSSSAAATVKRSSVGVLAFEISGLMSKLIHLWQSLSDSSIARLRHESICLEGVRKIVSENEDFLLRLACAEMVENLRLVAKSVSRLSAKCEDSNLRAFDRLLDEFSDTGRDRHGFVLSWKDMEERIKKMDHFVSVTATLHREMDELLVCENHLRKSQMVKECFQDHHHHHHHSKGTSSSIKEHKIMELQQKLLWQRNQVKYLKERSLWGRSFDTATKLLARSVFTILARIKLVFGVSHGYPASLPRSLSASATVYPSDQHPSPCSNNYVSGPLVKSGSPNLQQHLDQDHDNRVGFFELNSKIVKPGSNTLGSAALSLHYANLIIVIEKMIRSPQLVGADAKDDLYSMLPNSIRSSLRARLKGVGFIATDPFLAGEWRDALQKILGWLSPLAHNMIKWQSERSYEHQNILPKTNVLQLQTLHFADQDKTEAAITELLVGLNYIWRFEREMNAKALFECNFNGFLNLPSNSPNKLR